MKAIKWILIVLSTLAIVFFTLNSMAETHPKIGFMDTRISQIERLIIHRDVLNPEISSANVAWHLDHTLKAIINITSTLEESDPSSYSANVNIARTIMFSYGDFPRGVAKAPTSVTPPDVITNAEINDQITQAKEKVAIIHELPENSFMIHDTFGMLHRDHASRLIEVHTDHHLRIIEDILKAENLSFDDLK